MLLKDLESRLSYCTAVEVPEITQEEKIEALIHEHFDLRPKGIIEDLNLLQPIYRPTAAYGHFGRNDAGFPWEQTDKADALRAASGL